MPREAVLGFVHEKQVIVVDGAGKGRVQLQNRSKAVARGIEVRVTVAAGGERLRALEVRGEMWGASGTKALVVAIGTIEGGAAYDIVFAYEVGPPLKTDPPRAADDVVLRFEAVSTGCALVAANASVVVEVRLRIEAPMPVPARVPSKAPVDVKPIEARPVQAKLAAVDTR